MEGLGVTARALCSVAFWVAHECLNTRSLVIANSASLPRLDKFFRQSSDTQAAQAVPPVSTFRT